MKLIHSYLRSTFFVIVAMGSWIDDAHGQAHVPVIDDPYEYLALDQDIRDALAVFATERDVVMDIASDVRGRLRGHVAIDNGRKLFNQIAQASRSVWYYDGRRIFFRRTSSSGTRRIAAGHLGEDRRAQLMRQWPLASHGVTLSYDPFTRDLIADGPSEFTDAVARVVPVSTPSRVRGIEVHRFRTH